MALRNSVVFKVVQALRHANRRRLVCLMEKRKACASGAPKTPPRYASLTIALSHPADRCRQRPTGETIRGISVAVEPVILGPGCMLRIGIEVSTLHPNVLAADHAPQPREVALG